MYRREINKYIIQNCAPSWTYLRNYEAIYVFYVMGSSVYFHVALFFS